jgi:hypothetical protein
MQGGFQSMIKAIQIAEVVDQQVGVNVEQELA